mmetsp:Transcript_64119/g.171631  ORF Transcript_64119/g.171631 Transcript_64119/m.171631 type:complete len:134 (+) Transcript_64119:49-450(+)
MPVPGFGLHDHALTASVGSHIAMIPSAPHTTEMHSAFLSDCNCHAHPHAVHAVCPRLPHHDSAAHAHQPVEPTSGYWLPLFAALGVGSYFGCVFWKAKRRRDANRSATSSAAESNDDSLPGRQAMSQPAEEPE